MKIRSLLIVTGIAVLVALIFCALGYILILATFSLSEETLKHHENIDTLYFFTTFILILLTSFIAILYSKKGKKNFTLGIAIPVLLSIPLLFYLGGIYIDNFNYYQPFDKEIWLTERNKPLKMATTLTKKGVLINMTKQQVKDMLGKGTEEHYNEKTKRGSLIYYTAPETKKRWLDGRNDGYWEMQIFFLDEKVVLVRLFQGGYDY